MLSQDLVDLEKAKDKLHVLEGLKIAVENIDEVIVIIKRSRNDAEAQQKFSAKRFSFKRKTNKAIVDMRLESFNWFSN